MKNYSKCAGGYLNKLYSWKILKFMRNTLLLIFITVLQAYADDTYSQNTKLTLNLSNVTVANVLEEIQNKSEFNFLFNAKLIDVKREVTISMEDMKISEILTSLFSGTDVKYLVYDRQIILTTSDVTSLSEALQQLKITGKVTGKDGTPIPGANVVVTGTTLGTITDIAGKYSLEVPQGGKSLTFTFIGMVPQEITIGTLSQINVTLAESAIGLEEVVVVGYGTQKKANITGSVAIMKVDNLIERPLVRIDQAMVGEIAGVRVKQTSGMPGAGFSIQVRGTGSISANNEPLYVIDGFPLEVSSQNSSGKFSSGNPLDNINGNDIESIQVLKDASATAIYGSRGSNGVVLITTKRGQEGKAKITLRYSTGWNETSKKLDMLSGEEWADRATEMINAAYLKADHGQNRQVTDDYNTRIAKIGSLSVDQVLDPRWAMPGHPGLTYLNWQDEAFRKGPVNNVQLSATGGNSFVKYYISGDYLDQTGYIIGVDYKRYSARTNVEMKAGKKLTVSVNLAPSYSIGNDPGVEGKDQLMHWLAASTPVTIDTVGLYYNTGDYSLYPWGGSRNSPVMVLKYTTGLNTTFRTLATVFADYEISKGLNFKTTFNFDNNNYTRKFYKPAWVSGNVGARQASGSYSGYNRLTFVNDNVLTFTRSFGGVHNVSAIIGMSYNVNSLNTFQINSTGGFGTDFITTLNNANGINSSSTNTLETKNVLLSYFGRVEYSYKDKYLLNAIMRRDGSSRFGENTKWGLFPSVSAGWKISEESFMENVPLINFLKIRAAWGISGNESFGVDYGSIALLQTSQYTFNNALAVGQSSANFPNKGLGWEISKSINGGLDFGIMKDRITGSFDIYTKTNSNLLLNVPVPFASGFSAALTNIGEIKNKGWEVELTGRILTGELKWTSSINFSYNSNKVVKLSPTNAPILLPSMDIENTILTVGQPMLSIYVVRQDGILTQADINAGAALYGTETAGDPKYVDQITVDTNGDGIPDAKDGKITPADRVICGHPNPDYVWGFNNTISYKNFDLSFLVQGQQGGVIYSLFGRAVNKTGTVVSDNVLGTWRDRWRSAADPGVGLVGKTTGNFGRIKNTDWLYSNDYWRIRDITLGYNVDKLIKSKVISGARLYVTAENWLGKDKYTGGWNPEAVNTNGGSPLVGDDYGAAPLSRSMIFGIILNF